MSMPNQGARQLFLYDHGRPHWSQGGPLFYDRRMPPPPPGPHGPGAPHPMGNHFQNQPFPGQGPGAGPAPQWVRGPILGAPPPGPHPHPAGAPNHQQQLDGFGFNMPWNVANNNHYNHRHNNRNFNHRDNHRNHNGRSGGGGVAGAGGGGQVGGRNEHGEQRYLCCKCGDYLQNSNESGVHLCDANVPDNQQQSPANRERELSSEEIQSRLALLLESVKASCAEITDNPPLSEALQRYFAMRIEELASLETMITNESNNSEERLAELKQRLSAVEERDSQLKQQEESLEKERAKFDEECKMERAELARQWQQLRDEITRMEEMNNVQKGRIKLDVGGHIFTTSQLTLTREADSMLAAMFSGRHGLKKEEDGTIFIDRDGTHFRYILNYLRDGGLSTDALPRNKQTLRELRNEAVYFQLHGLVQHIEKFL
nr:hypothetical protein BaRGS_014791 [Batillaria attramentaria]